MRHSESKRALYRVMEEKYKLTHTSFETIFKNETGLKRPSARYAYTRALVQYLEDARWALLQSGRVDEVRRIENVFRTTLFSLLDVQARK